MSGVVAFSCDFLPVSFDHVAAVLRRLDVSYTDVVSSSWTSSVWCTYVACLGSDAHWFHVVGGWVFFLEREWRGTRPEALRRNRGGPRCFLVWLVVLFALCSSRERRSDVVSSTYVWSVEKLCGGLFAGGLPGVLVFVVFWRLF